MAWVISAYQPHTSQVLLIFYSKSSENIDACRLLNLENIHALIDILFFKVTPPSYEQDSSTLLFFPHHSTFE